jgi:uncharacterized protein
MRSLLAVVATAAFTLMLIIAAAGPARAADGKPIGVLIITGDHLYHNWKETTPALEKMLEGAGMNVDVTETPSKDLTSENLAKYDVLLLNYKDSKNGTAETRWSDANKRAFADAIRGGKGVASVHYASSAFIAGDDWHKEYERIIAGGWRTRGNHGKKHEFVVKIAKPDHPITRGMPAEFQHSLDELYQNSVMFDDSEVLCTAWSDKSRDPKNTDKHEPVVWVNKYGQGRVFNNLLGHDVKGMASVGFQTLMIRGVEWAATGDVKTPVPEELKTAKQKD